MTQPEKFDLSSGSIIEDQKAKLKQLFPEVITEGGKVDFDQLKRTLGEVVDAGKERYGMNWPGKADCFKTIQQPSIATLIPARDESVNFDETENLIIEGDNLEVLKLLQKSYMGKVKMIYIDPPYNTGNDFIYPDNYSESLETYLTYTGQVDAGGRKFSTNTEADGRFHSKWMNMMYPRLFLARNLLRSNGVIYISIDDVEMDNLKKICNEIFGEENFIGVIKRRAARKTAHLSKSMSDMCDYVVVYCKGDLEKSLSIESVKDQTRPVFNEGNAIVERLLRAGTEAKCEDCEIPKGRHSAKTLEFELLGNLVVKNGKVQNSVAIKGPFRINQALLDKTVFITRNKSLRRKLLPEELNVAKAMSDLWDDPAFYNERGSEVLYELFEETLFNNPKPFELISTLIKSVDLLESDNEEIILDFFAGSGSTAQALLDRNKQDGGSRRFILVQLPEPTGRKDFPTIAEITKERVRRVIKKLKEADSRQLELRDKQASKQDLGFKVFKLQSSNFKLWDGNSPQEAGKLGKQIEMHVDHIFKGRTQEDILYEILLKSGIPLTAKIETLKFGGKKAHSVQGGDLLVCLEKTLTLEAIRAMAEKKPGRVVCLDEAFKGNDQLKTNAVQTFKSKDVIFRTV